MKYILNIPFAILFIINLIMWLIRFGYTLIILTPFAFIFVILSIFNKEYFWNYIWCNFIDKLEKYNLITN